MGEGRTVPSHELFKKLGSLGFLGLNKPVEFGGQGLDYSYALMMAEELGAIHCGGVPMAIGVQTDMATPALARFGSDEVRREFLAPAIAGDAVACIGVSEPGAGSDVASIKTSRASDGDDYVINGGKMWITNGVKADWICLLANTGDGPKHRNKSLICVPMKSQRRGGGAKTRQDGDALVRHRADILRRGAGAEAQPDRRGRHGFYLPDGPVPGGAAVGRGRLPQGA